MSGLPWSSVCIKYLLFIFNLLFVVSGIVLISVGVSIKARYHEFELFLDDQYFSTPSLLIAIGVIIFMIAFLGCCGAVKENFCMTVTFSTLLILIFVLELAAGISGYVLRNQTADFLTKKLTDSLPQYNKTTNKVLTNLWDTMQEDFECCGVKGPKDWLIEATNNSIPVSCCKRETGLLGSLECTPDSNLVHKDGCADKFGQFVKDNAVAIGGIGIGLAFIQFLGVIFSCHLSRQIKRNYETV